MAVVPVAAAGYGLYLAGAAIGTALAGAGVAAYQVYQGQAKHAPKGPTREDQAALDKAEREAQRCKEEAAASRAEVDKLHHKLEQQAEEQQRIEKQRQQWEREEWQRQEELERERQDKWRQDVLEAEVEFEEQQRQIALIDLEQKKEAEKRKKEALERELEAQKQAEKQKEALLEMLKATQEQMQQMVARESQQKEAFMQQLEEIRRKEQEAIDYPVPPFLEKECRNVNIAVTGNSGVGKSSFINAVRRMKPNHPDAAKSEAVECTQDATRYAFPSEERVVTRISRVVKATKSAKGALGKIAQTAFAKMTAPAERIVEKTVDRSVDVDIGDKVCFEDGGRVVEGTLLRPRADGMWLLEMPDGEDKEVHEDLFGAVFSGMNIWDLPGVGTTKHPQCDYMKNMGIRHFDMVVLITGNRFTQGEVMLLHELIKFKVPYFLVRNLVDVSIDAAMSKFADSADTDMSKDEIGVEEQQRIADNVLETVKDGIADATGTNDFVYCISCLREHREKYDFLKLRGAITEALIAGRELQVASASSVGDLISCVSSTFEGITDQSQEVMAEATDQRQSQEVMDEATAKDAKVEEGQDQEGEEVVLIWPEVHAQGFL